MRTQRSLAAACAAVLFGCSTPDPLYCDRDTPCDDPERPFCDLEGTYPASEGVARTCIAEPDFALSVAGDAQVRAGGELALEVGVDRIAGFPGDIEVIADGLPDGVTADPLTIPDGETSGALTLRGGDADPGLIAVATVTATAGPFERSADLRLLVLGPPGSLDPTFGTFGIAGQPDGAENDDATLLTQQADGGFIVGGPAKGAASAAVLVRFTSDGVLDSEFGVGGWLDIPMDVAGVVPTGFIRLAPQGEDKIVLLAGSSSGDVVLVRVTRDGSRDATFAGEGGFADQVVSGNYLGPEQLVVGPNGEILAAVTWESARDAISIVRYSVDGARDPGFASDGRLDIDRGDSHSLSRIWTLPDGSFVVSGSAMDSGGTRVPFALRFTANGLPDTSFGNDGEWMLDPAWNLSDLRVDGQGRLIACGSREGKPTFFRFTNRGAVDSTFGDGGALTLPLPEDRTGSLRILLPGDDDLMAVGSNDIILARLKGDMPDPGFGDDGITVFELENLFAVAALRLADGRVVVLADNDSLPFVFARFFP